MIVDYIPDIEVISYTDELGYTHKVKPLEWAIVYRYSGVYNNGEAALPDGGYVDSAGNIIHFKNGCVHTDDDIPAIVARDMHEYNKYTISDSIFRLGVSCITDYIVTQIISNHHPLMTTHTYMWIKDNKLCRLSGPAVVSPNKYNIYMENDNYHRLDGPAIEWADGEKSWYIDGDHICPRTVSETPRLKKAYKEAVFAYMVRQTML